MMTSSNLNIFRVAGPLCTLSPLNFPHSDAEPWCFFRSWLSMCQGQMYQWTLRVAWWRHHMEAFSVLLVVCAGNSPVTGEFPSQRPVTRILDVFFDLCQKKLSSKQPRHWWFETPSRSLWRHCNVALVYVCKGVYVHACDDIYYVYLPLYMSWCACTKSCVFPFEMTSYRPIWSPHC